jgi:hypothetical protein
MLYCIFLTEGASLEYHIELPPTNATMTMTNKVENPVDKAALEEMSRGMVSKGIHY